jgi:hypothetical protein
MKQSVKAPTHRRDTQLGTVRYGTIAVNGVRYRPVPYRTVPSRVSRLCVGPLILGSKFGRDAEYSDRGISWFSSCKCRNSTSIRQRPFPSRSIIIHQSSYLSTLYNLDQWYSTWGMRTSGGTRRHLRGYVKIYIYYFMININ